MLLHALALVLASATDGSTLAVNVVSIDFSYPYYGEPGNTCQRGSVFIRATAEVNGAKTPVVVRMVDSAGLTPGKEAVLDGVRRAGKGRDGTPVFCASGRKVADPPARAVAAAEPSPPPVVEAPPPAPVAAAQPEPARAPTSGRCTFRLFHVVKKPLADGKVGPSEFDPDSAFTEPEAADCGLARSKVTNVLLLRMVKERHARPETVIGAEWGPGSKWERDGEGQRRVVKVYLADAPQAAASL